VIAALAAFVILKKVSMILSQSKTITLIFSRIGYATLGIYLIHPIILNALNDGVLGRGVAGIIHESALSIPFVAIVTFLLSYTVVEIMLHTPVVRNIV
jgi:surface polysaccharide O-acyltransferase-like enzyme